MKGFLTGLAAGLAVGYLTAPRSGKDTRDQLKDMADQQTKGLKDQWTKTTARVGQLVDTAKSQFGSQSVPTIYERADMNPGPAYGAETTKSVVAQSEPSLTTY